MLLVVETARSREETARNRAELERTRKQAIQPELEFAANEAGSSIVNVGNGPALDVDLTLTFEPDGYSHHLAVQFLDADDEVVVPVSPFNTLGDQRYLDLQYRRLEERGDLPDVPDEEIWETMDHPFETLVVAGSMRDMLANEYTVTKKYDCLNLMEGTGGYEDRSMPIDSLLYLVVEELGGIRRHLTGETPPRIGAIYESRNQSESRTTDGEIRPPEVTIKGDGTECVFLAIEAMPSPARVAIRTDAEAFVTENGTATTNDPIEATTLESPGEALTVTVPGEYRVVAHLEDEDGELLRVRQESFRVVSE